MIFNSLKMVILRPLEIIVTLVAEFWTKLFLQFWNFVMKISKVQIIWTMSSVIFKWTDFFQKRLLHTVLHKLRRAWSILKNAKSLNIIILVNHLWPKTSADQTRHAPWNFWHNDTPYCNTSALQDHYSHFVYQGFRPGLCMTPNEK